MTAMGKRLRRIGGPVIAAAPSGVRVRTRIHLSDGEAQALTVMGGYLGSVYRAELSSRIGLGRLDCKQHRIWRAERKRVLTAVSSSRWAGAITRAVEDQYQLGMRALAAHVSDLRAAVQVLAARCALRPGAVAAPVRDVAGGPRRRSRRPVRGYRGAAERFTKTPTRPPRRRGMPVHQPTPTVSGQHRSGRTPAELTSAD
jgi:hypothetical protein